MKVTFRTVTNKNFSLNIEDDTKIADVKKTVEAQGEYQAEGMKLVYKGEFLKDELTIKETNYAESDFIVVVSKKIGAASKKKPTTTTATPSPAPISTPAPVTPAPAPAQSTPPPVTQVTPAPTTTGTVGVTPAPAPLVEPASADANRIVTGDTYKAAVDQFLEMGFEQSQIEACMRAAFNNPERAADYLMGGIPEGLQQASSQQAPPSPSQQDQQQMQLGGDDELYEDEGAYEGGNPLESLLQGGAGGGLGNLSETFPQFNQLRAAIQQNPSLLQPILQRIAQTSPQLYQIIQQNPQEFIRLLNDAPTTGPPQPQQGAGGANPLAAAMGGGGGAHTGPGAPPPGTIFVTPQEKLAIDELVSLGFTRMAAAQAYFACDKNQELAANFLLENQFTDEDMQDFSHQFGGDDNQEGNNQQ
ncbi:UV excision repair protein RAD23 [Acrasis kona]|uniref:UV excision repair protein RAD23 n=1 Tax=Acrasis kona TaxID=1008807 RepID=A0AAW2YK30_9EUKA